MKLKKSQAYKLEILAWLLMQFLWNILQDLSLFLQNLLYSCK